jgi:hypothetical protein
MSALQNNQTLFDHPGPHEALAQIPVLRSDEQVTAAPTRGVSLEMRTARRGKPIRDAVAVLVREAVVSPDEQAFHTAFSPRWSAVRPRIVEARLATRIAWNLVASWLFAAAHADGTA